MSFCQSTSAISVSGIFSLIHFRLCSLYKEVLVKTVRFPEKPHRLLISV